jgi:hypothetical protein
MQKDLLAKDIKANQMESLCHSFFVGKGLLGDGDV